MGCGMSTLEMDDASPSRRSNRVRHHAMAPPPVNKGDEGVTPFSQENNKGVAAVMKPSGDEEAKTKEDAFNDERSKEKGVAERNNKEEERVFHGDDEKPAKIIVKNNEEKNEDRDIDSYIIGPRSPSFREYCTEYDSGDRSSVGDSNDCDSRESIKNGSDDDSTSMKNKPKSEGSINSNKEHEKKERRGRGFRNVMNRGKGRGKRNLLNFACYNASTESYAENSFNKIVEKAA